HTRPLQRFELGSAGTGATLDDRRVAPSLRRLARGLARDAPRAAGDSVATGRREPGVSPRLLQSAPDPDTRIEISAALEGAGELDQHDSRFVSGSGLRVRTAVQVDRWLAYSHLVFGQIDSART